MTTLLALALLLGVPPDPRSTVAKVVIYPDRAQVTRRSSVPCGSHVVLAFPGIPPAADPASFRAQSSGGTATVTVTIDGLRVEERTRAEAFTKKAKDLDGQVRKLSAEVAALRDAHGRDENTARVAALYDGVAQGLIGREMSEPGPNTQAWAAALDATLAARLKAAADLTAAGAKLRELEHRLDELRGARARIAAAAGRNEYLAEAIVSCQKGQRAEVELTYLVGGAAWQPAYEARADDAGTRVTLSTYATVTQSTGEDWSRAQVILSTAIPRQNATPPEIAPLKVMADSRPPPKKVLVSREEYHEHPEEAATTPATVRQSEAGNKNNASSVRIAQQGLSVQFQVPEPADILGDGTPARLFIARTGIPAQLRYRAVPKLMPFVFRVAELSNAAPFPLLPGPVDIYRRGSFLARYDLERVPSGGRFHLTFGLEERMKARRVTVEEMERDRGLFGTTHRRRYAYRFEVANYLGQQEEIEVSEHLPVSELDDVKVTLDGKTSAGYQLNAPDGIVSWRVRLRPGEQRLLDLLYHVDVPASYDP